VAGGVVGCTRSLGRRCACEVSCGQGPDGLANMPICHAGTLGLPQESTRRCIATGFACRLLCCDSALAHALSVCEAIGVGHGVSAISGGSGVARRGSAPCFECRSVCVWSSFGSSAKKTFVAPHGSSRPTGSVCFWRRTWMRLRVECALRTYPRPCGTHERPVQQVCGARIGRHASFLQVCRWPNFAWSVCLRFAKGADSRATHLSARRGWLLVGLAVCAGSARDAGETDHAGSSVIGCR